MDERQPMAKQGDGGNAPDAVKVAAAAPPKARRQKPLRPLSAAQRDVVAGRLRDEGLRIDHLETIPRRRGKGPAPLSYAQQRLWVIDQLAGGSAFYNVVVALQLSGRLEVAALAGALDAVVRRHETLRTTFPQQGGKPLQVVAASGAASRLRLVDLAGLAAGRSRAEARRLAQTEARRPFDLAKGPLMRSTLLRLGAGEHAFLLTLHHVIFDGWSSAVLVHEVTTLYAAGVAGRPSPLAELPIQYADYAEWQRQWLEDGRLAGQLSYWRQQLAGSPPALELPADHPRPPVESHRGRFHPVRIPARTVDGLRALARAEGATLFMALVAIFGTVLYRHSGQPDVLIGTPVANRKRSEIEGLIGYFANTLVLRLDLRAAPPFRVLLGQARATAQAAYAHQDLPFERLVEELQPGRELRRSPLFQVMLVLQNATRSALEVAGLNVARLDVEPGVAKFDLMLDVIELDGGLAGGLEFATDLFERATIERLLGHLTALLAAAVADPETSVGELPMLGDAERAQLLWEWNDTPDASPPAGRGQGQDVLARFRQQVRMHPQAPALTVLTVLDGGGRDGWTYGDLATCAGLLARRLRRLGVGPDVRVGVLAERAPERVAALLAVLAAGGVYVPLDPLHPRQRLLLILADAGVSVLVGRQAAMAELDWQQGPQVDWETWRQEAASDPPGDQPTEEEAAAEQEEGAAAAVAESLAYVIYTSGSTGAPKGVALPRRTLDCLLRWHPGQLPGAARTLQFAAPGFDVSLQEDLSTLCSGGELVVIPEEVRRDPERLLRLIDEEQVARIFLPMVALQSLAAAARRVTPAAGALRDVVAAGETLRITPPVAEWLARMPGCTLHNHYGPSESHVVTALRLAGASRDWPQLPAIGRPVPGARIQVLDARREPVPIGVAGELAIGGPPLARGYLRQPRLTAERFVPDPHAAAPGERLYRSGDLARWRPDGSLELLGRSDRQIKVRGMRVEPAEIEAVLEQLPGVSQAVVEAREDPSGNRRLVAYLAGEQDAELDAAHITRTLRARLPEPMVPVVRVLPGGVPLTANGKIDRQALADLAAVGAGDATDAAGGELTPPRDAVEEMLAAIWCSLLELPAVSIDDDFFALGGHSLLATQLVSRVRDACGSELPLQRVFEAPTLAAMAEAIRGSGGVGAVPPLVPLAEPGDRVLSFAQQRLWFLDRLVPDNPFYNMFHAFDLAGAISLSAFAAALREIVRRHQALRTVFREAQGAPLQVVLAAGLDVPRVDLEALPAAAAAAEVARLARQEAARPFDLACGPMVRAQFLRLAAERHVLLLNVHHVACDGWSIGVFERELVALYQAFAQGAPSPLPELPIQYGDFAVWQRGWLQGEALAYRLGYWLHHLAGAPADLELPHDRPRPAVERFRGRGTRLTIPASLVASLRELARAQGATLYMVLLAGWKALLSRYSGQTRIVVGSAVANRRRSETEALIGFFVNVVVMHTDLAGDPGFGELVGRVRDVALGAFAHQDLPFEMLVEKLQVERDLGRNPLCQVMFTFQNFPRPGTGIPGLAITTRNAAVPDTGSAKFDLALFASEAGAGVDFYLEYSTDLFDAATMARLLAHLESLLRAGAAAPGRPLAELPLLAPAERHQLLVEWNDAPRGLHRLTAVRAARPPAATPPPRS